MVITTMEHMEFINGRHDVLESDANEESKLAQLQLLMYLHNALYRTRRYESDRMLLDKIRNHKKEENG